MNYVLLGLTNNLVSIICIVAAAYLSSDNNENWGWFLFAALVFGVSHVIPDRTTDPANSAPTA